MKNLEPTAAVETDLQDAYVPAPSRQRRRGPSVLLWVTAGIITTYAIVAVLAPLIIPYDAHITSVVDRLLPPGASTSSGMTSFLGTDEVGRDLWAQIVHGARISMLVGTLSLALAGVIGTLLGILAGYFGGAVDAIVMRLADIQLAFPSILLAVFIAAILGPSVTNVILTLAVTNWPVFARVARGQTISTRDRDYADAARTLGASGWYVIRHVVSPAVVSPVLVIATVQFGLVVVAEASLSFLGLGIPTGTASWGTTIANGRDYLDTAWWIATMPGIALVILVTCAGILGDRLRDILDPQHVTR